MTDSRARSRKTSTAGSTTSASSRAPRKWKIGARVVVRNYGKGVVRFQGETHFAPGFFVGVELDSALGKHNGFYDGKRYFSAKEKTGVFVRDARIEPLERPPSSGSESMGKGWSILCQNGLKVEALIFPEASTPSSSTVQKAGPARPPPPSKDLEAAIETLSTEPPLILPSPVPKNPKAPDPNTLTISRLEFLLAHLKEELYRLKPEAREQDRRRKKRHRSHKSLSRASSTPHHARHSSSSNQGLKRSSRRNSSSHSRRTSTRNNNRDPQNNDSLLPTVVSPTKDGADASDLSDHGTIPRKDATSTNPDKNAGMWPDDGEGGSKEDDSQDDDEVYSDETTHDEDEDENIQKLKDEVEEERRVGKRKDKKIKELEKELKEFDEELKTKSRSLVSKAKAVERLEKYCADLSMNVEKAEQEAEAWQFEVLYGRGEHPMQAIKGGQSKFIVGGKEADSLAAFLPAIESKDV